MVRDEEVTGIGPVRYVIHHYLKPPRKSFLEEWVEGMRNPENPDDAGWTGWKLSHAGRNVVERFVSELDGDDIELRCWYRNGETSETSYIYVNGQHSGTVRLVDWPTDPDGKAWCWDTFLGLPVRSGIASSFKDARSRVMEVMGNGLDMSGKVEIDWIQA